METPSKNYTVSSYRDLFQDLGTPSGWLMWEDTRPLLSGLPPPRVEVFCLHGANVSSTERLVYDRPGQFPDGDPSAVREGDGDGAVNLRSLVGCSRWAGRQEEPVHHHVWPGLDHQEVMRREEPVGFVTELVTRMNRELVGLEGGRTRRRHWSTRMVFLGAVFTLLLIFLYWFCSFVSDEEEY